MRSGAPRRCAAADGDVDRCLRAHPLADGERQPGDGLRAAVTAGSQRHRNRGGVQERVGHAAHRVALEQPAARRTHHDQSRLVFDGGLDQARGERLGVAHMELDADVLRNQCQPLTLCVQHRLLAGTDMAAVGILRRMRDALFHHIDEVELGALRPGQRGRQGNGVGAAFVWCVANYVSHG